MCTIASLNSSERCPTDFENRVYQACSLIPKGKVSTYGTLARLLDSSPRAVGQALRRNPFAPNVPCHRVVSTTMNIGGFNGTWATGPQVDHKRELLLQEQVAFDSHCNSTISKASLVSLQELEQLMQKHTLKAED